jgi:sulfur-oxidizing protein SoxB
MNYAIAPNNKIGARISDMSIGGEAIEAGRRYKVAGWAPVAEGASGEPIWELASRYLRSRKILPPLEANRPRLIGVQGNLGMS